VGLLVVQDGDGFGLDGVDDVVGGKRTLLVVAPDGAEEIVRLDGVGDQRRRGSGRDGDDAFLLVYVDGRHRGARARVRHGELRALVDDPVGGRNGLLGFAAVVDEQRLELEAFYAARFV